jgi:hypothetical protein
MHCVETEIPAFAGMTNYGELIEATAKFFNPALRIYLHIAVPPYGVKDYFTSLEFSVFSAEIEYIASASQMIPNEINFH